MQGVAARYARSHPTRRASRDDLPLQGRWGNIVIVAASVAWIERSEIQDQRLGGALVNIN
jgi:hypothetical protein